VLDLQVDGAARRRDHGELGLAAGGVDGAHVEVTVLETEGELVGPGDEADLAVVADHRGARGQGLRHGYILPAAPAGTASGREWRTLCLRSGGKVSRTTARRISCASDTPS
jgi:hypothetical protein